MALRVCAVLALLAALLAGLQAAPAAAGDVGQEGPTGAAGCLAVRGSRVLESSRADERRTPASVQKLAVTAAALELLGPDYRVRTRLEAAGEIVHGRLDGDLVVRAAGDPTWSRRFFDHRESGEPGPADRLGHRVPLARLAAAVRSSGVRRVAGDLVVDLSRFPGRPAPASRAMNEIAFGYAAPTGGLAIEENAVALRMAPGRRVGERPVFETSREEAVEIVNLATTVPAARHEKGTVDFQAQWHSGQLVIRGEYPISEPAYDIEIAVADGELRAARRLLAALRAAGVDVEGEVRLATAAPPAAPPAGQLVAELDSPPLAEWLPPILVESQNWLSEMLLRVLAADKLGHGRTGDGLELLETVLREQAGIAGGSVALDDASGISPYNLWTPRAVVRLLEWAWSRPWRDAYVAALARPGHGTLQTWPALPSSLAAKTGTQRQVLGLAGFLLLPGEPVIFACLLDHRVEPRPELRRELASRVRHWHRLGTHEQR